MISKSTVIVSAGHFSDSSITTCKTDDLHVVKVVSKFYSDDIEMAKENKKPKPIKKRVLPPKDPGRNLKPKSGFAKKPKIVKKP